MTTLREAAQQALKKLEFFAYMKSCSRDTDEVITALRAALAEPVEFDHGIGADRFKVVRGAFWWHVLIGDSPTEHGKFRSRAGAEKMAADLLREFRNGAFVQHEAALAEPCPCGDRPADQCSGEWEPDCNLGNNPKYAKRVELTPKELAASIKRGEKWKVAEPVQEPDLSRCPKCNGPADNGHDRSIPPSPYFCTKCMAEPVQEPVGEVEAIDEDKEEGTCHAIVALYNPVNLGDRLYTAPPQRKPLTEEEIIDLWEGVSNPESPEISMIDFARAIERAHGIGGSDA